MRSGERLTLNQGISIKELLLDIGDNSQCVICKEKAKQLVFIKVHSSFVPDIIHSLENRNLSLSESIMSFQIFSVRCKNVPSDKGSKIGKKSMKF